MEGSTGAVNESGGGEERDRRKDERDLWRGESEKGEEGEVINRCNWKRIGIFEKR